MRLWRLVPERRAAHAFDGEGARLYGGRWNSVGTRVVYLSSTISLAALEILVHADLSDLPPHVAIALDVPPSVEAAIEPFSPGTLSARWREPEPPDELRRFGDAWAKEGRSVLASFPSVIIPAETNYLLNPAHSHFKQLTVLAKRPFELDSRLLRLRDST